MNRAQPKMSGNAPPRPAPPSRFARRARVGLLVALVLSLLVHFVLSLWPIAPATNPEEPPLEATITELPPPPAPVAAATPKPLRKAKRPRVIEPQGAIAELPQEPAAAAEAPLIDPTPQSLAMGPELPAVPVEPLPSEVQANAADVPSPKGLPPRVDLVYKGYLGVNGLEIGRAVYRFEHTDTEYRITTIGELKGILAIFFPGQAKLESHGSISSAGLQPVEFSLERGSRDRREVAQFDWETGIVFLHDQKTATLEIPTFDALSIMWQYYFAPPKTDQVSFSLATTRKVNRYTVTREGSERITWGHGEIETERWHHQSDDGKLEGYAWLAPSLHFIPIKLRYVGARATVEGVLDSIRVDEPLAQQ